ncbi:MAG TPA: aa3-type cytochrome c oxidase subunit IV [Caulobacterales bacterium]|nr:aa3-type cytochrome c oxidase subunit IV [Caulobacterales bacterium]
MSTDAHAAADHGHMDIHEQKETFGHFVTFALCGTLHLVMAIALLTVAFAIGAGWFAGVAAFFAIGAAAGLAMRLGGAWWAAIVAQTVLLAIGGAIVSLVA